MYSNGPPHMVEQKQDDLLEHTYSSCVRIRDVALKTCQRWWTKGKSDERGSGISVLAARHDDDDESRIISRENSQCKNIDMSHSPNNQTKPNPVYRPLTAHVPKTRLLLFKKKKVHRTWSSINEPLQLEDNGRSMWSCRTTVDSIQHL